MHALYNFDFLETISKQLQESLDGLVISVLNTEAIADLSRFQVQHKRRQGVYVIHYDGLPRYIGKADNVADRLSQHFRKLIGRQNISPESIGYKCLILDSSMSTAANEKLLISRYKKVHGEMWNGRGFGPKDPGRERDTTAPNYFDGAYPIRLDLNLEGIEDETTLLEAAEKMKSGLPYVFRFNLGDRRDDVINLKGVPRTPDHLLQALIDRLGNGWRGAILSYGLVFYPNVKNYRFGLNIDPRHADL